jgi:hypothetical protein
VEGFFVHWAVFDPVQRASGRPGVSFEAIAQHDGDRRFAAPDRSHKEQYALSWFEARGSSAEVFHDLGDRLLKSKKLLAEECVARLPVRAFLNTILHDHVVDSGVSELSYMRILDCDIEILLKRTGPVQLLLLLTVRLKPSTDIHAVHE